MRNFLLDQFPKFVWQNKPNKSNEAITASDYNVTSVEAKIAEFNTKYKGRIDKSKIEETLESIDDGDEKLSFNEWKTADRRLKAFLKANESSSELEKIPTREALAKRKKSEIVKFVLSYPDKAMEFFLAEAESDSFTVNFQGISQTLLGLGHFRAFTDKYQHVEVNGVRGTLGIKPGQKKPGYFTENGEYLAIWDGDTIKGIPRKTIKPDETMSEADKQEAEIAAEEYENFKKDADSINQQYLENLITAEMTAEEIRLKLMETFSKKGIQLGDLDLSSVESIKKISVDEWHQVITSLSGREVKAFRKSFNSRDEFADFIQMCGLETYGQLSRNQIADKAQAIINTQFAGRIFDGAGFDDAKLVGSLMYHESIDGRPYAINRTGNCVGLGQIWENNYENGFNGEGGFNPFDPDVAVQKAVEYLAGMYKEFSTLYPNDSEDALKLAVVGYNRGPGFTKTARSTNGAGWFNALPRLAKDGKSAGTYGKEGYNYWGHVTNVYHDRVRSRNSASIQPFSAESLVGLSDAVIENILSIQNNFAFKYVSAHERLKKMKPSMLSRMAEFGEKFGSSVPKPVITCTIRDESENKDVGGVDRSQHLHGKAVDIRTKGYSESQITEWMDFIEKKWPHTVLRHANKVNTGDHVHWQFDAMA